MLDVAGGTRTPWPPRLARGGLRRVHRLRRTGTQPGSYAEQQRGPFRGEDTTVAGAVTADEVLRHLDDVDHPADEDRRTV